MYVILFKLRKLHFLEVKEKLSHPCKFYPIVIQMAKVRGFWEITKFFCKKSEDGVKNRG